MLTTKQSRQQFDETQIEEVRSRALSVQLVHELEDNQLTGPTSGSGVSGHWVNLAESEEMRSSEFTTSVSLNWGAENAAIELDGVQIDDQKRQLPVSIPTRWTSPNHYRLTVNVKSLLRPLQAVVLSKALQSNFAIKETVIDIEEDPEERTSRVVVRFYTAGSAVQTLSFWDSLEIEMERWLARLNTNDKTTLLEQIALRFHWSSH